MLIQTAYHIINRMFLGRLGDEAASALAAIGVSSVALMIQFAVMMGLSAGTTALVSRFLGGEDYKSANEAARQSMILCVLVAVISMLPLVFFAGPIVILIGAKGEVVHLAADYLRIIALFSIPMFLYMAITGVLRSAGDVRSPLYVGGIVILLNIVLDYFLIFGTGSAHVFGMTLSTPGFGWGVNGAAIATSASRLVGMILMFGILSRSVLRESMSHFTVQLAWFMRIARIGWPAILQEFLWSAGFAVYMRVLSCLPDATSAQAALTVAVSIEMICFMPGMAYSMAATPLVGQNLGAKNPKRAEQCAWVATWQAVGIMSVISVVLIAFPRQLAMLFTDREPVVSLIASYLRINGFAEPFLAIGMVLTGALQGAGDTRMPTTIEFIVNWAIRIPLVCVLTVPMGFGAIGAWYALSITTVLYGLLLAIWFKRGNWRTVKV